MIFDISKSIKPRGSMAFHIVLEEAHRYVQNDNDINLLWYNIFERISKEGRKYGIETETIVLSNTHDYRENGKIVPIEE